MGANFYQNIFNNLSRESSRIYIRWPEAGDSRNTRSYTGKEILNRVSLYRQLLKEEGIRSGDCILIAVAVDIELLCMLLAVMANGAVPVLPPAGIKVPGLLAFLRKKEVKGVFAPPQGVLLKGFCRLLFGVKLLTIPKISTYAEGWEPPVAVAGEQAALISHSSGSTGKSKAIVRSHRTLQAQHEALKQAFPPFEGQRDFPLFPNILLHNLSVGVCSIIPCLPRFNVQQMEPEKVLRQMQEEEVHTLTGNVYYFKKLLGHLQKHPIHLPAIRALGIGGSPVPERMLRSCKKFFPGATIYAIYGSTEAEPIAIRKVTTEKQEPQRGYGVGTFHPALQWRLRTVGEVLLSRKAYAVGEVEVRGAHVVSKGGEGWLSTGDFGYANEEGELFLTGRKGNEKLHKGVQHYQLEHFLQETEGVEAAAAIAGEAGFTLYVQGKVSKKELEGRLKKAFPAAVIQAVHFRKQLAMDPRHHSKIVYAKLS